MDEHPGGALDQRLDDHRGDLLLVDREDPRQVGGVAGLGRVRLEEQRPVGGVEEVDAADRDRADRVAVVGVAQVDEGGAADVLAAALLLVLEGHLQRDLGRGRARVRVEDPREAGGRDLDQAGGELGGAGVGEAEHGRVGDPPELFADGGVDRRVAMPVDVAPERGDPVDVAASLGVDQVGSPRRARSISGSSSTQPCCWVNGCQRWSRSSLAWSADIAATTVAPAPAGNSRRASRAACDVRHTDNYCPGEIVVCLQLS